MRVLLDTHIFIWWLGDDRSLSKRARSIIGSVNNEIFVSPVSAFEISTKFRLGKLPEAASFVTEIEELLERAGFQELALSTAHATRAGLFQHPHRDPFDRLLAAQSLGEHMPLISVDPVFDSFMVERIE